MSSFESCRRSAVSFLARRARQTAAFPVALVIATVCPLRAEAQQQAQGFAVERFYPSAAGGGWFVMDDLNIGGGFGGAVALTTGYARKPLEVSSPDGTQHLALVSDEAFVDVNLAATYRRYRVYLDFPMPLLVTGTSGTVGSYQLVAPAVNVGTNPDTISDPRVGLDMRLLGKPGNVLRVGVGAQLIIPSGTRADYVTDGTFRGMVRLLAAGDAGRFSYAGQLGLHIRPIADSPAPGSPNGNEFLFGLATGRRFSVGTGWAVVIGPEMYGETAFDSFFGSATGVEGLVAGRLEGTGEGRRVRLKLGAGRGLDAHFGAPEWRVVFGVELFGQRADRGTSPAGISRTTEENTTHHER
jgi:hypothetical protein